MSVKEASNECGKKEVTLKETEQMYKKTDGGASAHGHFMEINLLTLFKLQGDKHLEEFYLAGNFSRAGVFDDVVFRYVDDRERHNVIFLQAKSKANNTDEVGLEIFKTGGMFDLQKHFKGFLNIQDEWNNPDKVGPIFQGKAENSYCHYVMYTNAIWKQNMIEHIYRMDTNPLSIVLGQTSGHACKLKVDTATKLLREILDSNEIQAVITLLKKLSNTSKNMQRDEIFNMYHAFLRQTVLIKNGNKWMFRNEFLEGGCQNETQQKFRDETIKWYAEEKLGNTKIIKNDEITAHMRAWEVQLPDCMEKVIPIFETALCDKFIETASQFISGNICTIKNMRKDLMKKLAKFVGKVFVFDENNAMFKFNEDIDGEPGKMMDYMRSKLNVQNLHFDFQFEKFPKLSLGFTKMDSKMKDFISKLTILTGQPNADDLKDIIKNVILVNFSNQAANIRCLEMTNKITHWWGQRHSSKYLGKNDQFFAGILGGIKFHLRDPLGSFIGRTHELEKLHQALQNNKDPKNFAVISQMTSISGLGGIGKTEFARKYANEYGDSYDENVIWIDAETHNSMADSFRELCKDHLKIPTQNADKDEMEISSVVQEVYRFFRNQKCLFIFDNATGFKCGRNDNDGIQPFCPTIQQSTGHHFIITSRKQDWPSKINIQIDVLNDGEAEQLVKLSLGIEDGHQSNDVKDLINQLGNFPLALQQALAYIKQMDRNYKKASGKPFTISDYLKVYASKTKDLLDFEFPSDCNDTYTKTTFMTWNITLAAIEKHKLGKEARQVVNIMAYLNPNDIPTTFFTDVVDKCDEKLIEVFNLIDGYSMITLHDGKANIHRLVQSVTRITLQGAKQKSTLIKVLGLIRNHTNNNLVTQGALVWNYMNQDADLVKEFHTIPAKIILALNKTVRYEQALEFGKESLNTLKCVMGADHPSTLATQHNVAQILYYLGKYEEALCSYREVLEKEIKILGPDNPSTLTTQHNIGLTLFNQGKYEEALRSYTEVFQKTIKILGPDHPETLITQHNVAQTLSQQGKYEEALCSYREVLDKQIKILGPDNPSTLITLHHVAQTLFKQGKYEEALWSYREVLEKKIKILGPDNPSTLITQHNVAQTLSQQGKYEEAICSYKEVLEKQIKILGPDNPLTLETLHSVAQTLSDQGKYTEALCSYREVLDKQIKILGPDNPSTLNTQHNIGLILSYQGKYEEALCSYREVLDKQIKLLGPDNPSTLSTQHNVGLTLSNQGKYEEALCSYREVLEKRIKIVGPDHPDTLITQHNVGLILSIQGKYEEALCSYREVIDKQIKIFGPDNPSTLTTQHNVAQTLSEQGKHEEALCSYREVLEKQIKILGPDNPSTLTTQHNVAHTLSNQGKYEEALCSYRDVLEKKIEILGPDNPSTLITQRNIAQILSIQKKSTKCAQRRTD